MGILNLNVTSTFSLFRVLRTHLARNTCKTRVIRGPFLVNFTSTKGIIRDKARDSFTSNLAVMNSNRAVQFIARPLRRVRTFKLSLRSSQVIIVQRPGLLGALHRSTSNRVIRTTINGHLNHHRRLQFTTVSRSRVQLVNRVTAINILLRNVHFEAVHTVQPVVLHNRPALIIRTFPKVTNSITVTRAANRHLVRYTRVVRHTLPIHASSNRATMLQLFHSHIFRRRRKHCLRHTTSYIKGIMTFGTRQHLFGPGDLHRVIRHVKAYTRVTSATRLTTYRHLLNVIINAIRGLFLITSTNCASNSNHSARST